MIRDQEFLNQILETVSRFVRERLIPLEAQVAEEGKIPDAIVQEMKDLGFLASPSPKNTVVWA